MTTGALSVGGIEPVNLAEAFGKFDETWSPGRGRRVGGVFS